MGYSASPSRPSGICTVDGFRQLLGVGGILVMQSLPKFITCSPVFICTARWLKRSRGGWWSFEDREG